MNDPEIPYEIIAKFFKGECNDEELVFLESWRRDSTLNEDTINQLITEWVFIRDKNIIYPDFYNTWKKIQLKTDKISDSKPNQSTNKVVFFWKIASVAATIALLISLGITLILTKQNTTHEIELANLAKQETVILTPPGQKTHMELPDGTLVWLNSNSKLIYHNDFNRRLREVSLEGEGFFDVAKNPEKQFIVNTSHIKISVLGTTFDVQAYPEASDIKISLVTGKVSLESQEKQYLGELDPSQSVVFSKKNMQSIKSNQYLGELKPGQSVIIAKKDLKCKWSENNDSEAFSSWTKNQLAFYNANIDYILPELEKWYGININFINPDKNQKYSFTVKTESLNELLELFNQITPIKYTINGKEVTINRK